MAERPDTELADRIAKRMVELGEGVVVLEGLLGQSPRQGYCRLYFVPEFNDFAEINEEDIFERLEIPKAPQTPLGGHVLWVRKSAKVQRLRIEATEVEAQFLRGQLASRLTAISGPVGVPNLQVLASGVACVATAISALTVAICVPATLAFSCIQGACPPAPAPAPVPVPAPAPPPPPLPPPPPPPGPGCPGAFTFCFVTLF